MRKRYVQDPKTLELIEVSTDYQAPAAPLVIQDTIAPYESPASGRMIESRSARRQDFKRTKSRPYEGLEVENREAQKHRAGIETKFEQQVSDIVDREYSRMRNERPSLFRKVGD